MNKESGQAMLLTITLVVGALVGATVIAGTLMTRQIRQATGGTNSAQAIFASEAGIEYQLYKTYGRNSSTHPYPSDSRLSNGAIFVVSTSSDFCIKSVGKAGSVSRALQICLSEI